jgi:hypothetical protein
MRRGVKKTKVFIIIIILTGVSLSAVGQDSYIEVIMNYTDEWLGEDSEWNRKFKQEFEEMFAANPVSLVSLRAVLRSITPRELPDNPSEAAYSFGILLRETDESVRRGEKLPQVSAKIKQLVRTEGITSGGFNNGGAQYREKALERIKAIRRNPENGYPLSGAVDPELPGLPDPPGPPENPGQ